LKILTGYEPKFLARFLFPKNNSKPVNYGFLDFVTKFFPFLKYVILADNKNH